MAGKGNRSSAGRLGLSWALFVVVLGLGSMVGPVDAQCCLEFDGFLCGACPLDMHLYQGNCLLNIPNCIEYQNGFECSLCNNGYRLDALTKECTLAEFSDDHIPKNGFSQLPADQYYSNIIRSMQTATKQYLKAKGFMQEVGLAIKIYARKSTASGLGLPQPTEDRFLRFIYYTSTGYIDVITFYRFPNPPLSEQFVAINQWAWDKRPDEDYTNWANYLPAGHKQKVLEILQSRYPQQSKLEILEVFRSIKQYMPRDISINLNLNSSEALRNTTEGKGRKIYIFRLLLVDPNNGISSLEIPIIAPEETEILDVSKIDNDLKGILSILRSSSSFAKYLVGTEITNLTITQDTYNATYTHVGILLRTGGNGTNPISFIAFIVHIIANRVEIVDSFFYLATIDSNNHTIPTTSTIKWNTENIINGTAGAPANFTLSNITKLENRGHPATKSYSDNSTSPQTLHSATINPAFQLNPTNFVTNFSRPSNSPATANNGTNKTTSMNQTSTTQQPRKAFTTNFTTNFTTSKATLKPPQKSSPTITPSSLNPPLRTANNPMLLVPTVLGVVNKGSPTFKLIDPDFNMVELMDTTKLLQSKIYTEIRNVIVNYRSKNFINGNLLRASFGQNQTIYAVQIVYEQSQYYRSREHYSFGLNKNTQYLELLRQFTVPSSEITVIEPPGPARLGDLPMNLKQILENRLPTDPYYNSSLKLNSIVALQFTSPFSINSPSTKLFTDYYLKFQYSGHPTYDYIEFRFELADRKLDSLRSLGRIFYEKQTFMPYLDTSFIRFVILPYLVSFLKVNPSNIELFSVEASQARKDVYRALLSLNNLTNLTYLFDIKSPKPIKLVQNNTKESASTLAAPIQDPAPPIPMIPEQFNVFTFLQFFPYLYFDTLWRPVPIRSTSPDQLSISNATSIISKFFSVNSLAIANVAIINRQTLLSVLDSYTLQYTEYVPTFNPATNAPNFYITAPRLFTFQIPTKSLIPFSSFQFPFLSSSGLTAPPLSNSSAQSTPKQKNPINVSKQLASQKPVQVLETILNRNISVLAETLKASSNTQGSGTQNIWDRSSLLNNYLASVPSIVPISYSKLPKSPQISKLSLGNPEQPNNTTIELLANTIPSPNTYTPDLVVVESQRKVKDDPTSIIVSLSHAYFGEMKILASLKDSTVLEIDYANSGYLINTNDTGIVLQVEEIYNTTRYLNAQTTSILKSLNYSESRAVKIVSEDDIIYWRLKRIQNVLQYQFVYEFSSFIIRAGVLQEVDEANKSNTRIYLTNMEALSNSNRQLLLSKIKSGEDFKRVEAKMLNSFSFYLKEHELRSVEVEAAGDRKIFNLTYTSKLNPHNFYIFQAESDSNYTITITMLYSPENSMQQVPEGCLEPEANFKCAVCRLGYKLHKKDLSCYKQVQNCYLQTGDLCLVCLKGYILANYNACT